MRLRFMPGRLLLQLLAAAAVAATVALLLGIPVNFVASITMTLSLLLLATVVADLLATWREWRASPVRMLRRLPSAFAIGVRQTIHLQLESSGTRTLHCELFDHCDASLEVHGLPAAVDLPPGKYVDLAYDVTPTRRGQ